MKITAKWNEKLSLTANADGHAVVMDSKPPLGNDNGMTPKQLVVAGLCGCTAMDVISLMKKYKQPLEAFEIEADVDMSEEGHPIVFKTIALTFKLVGFFGRGESH
jgi:putative redox protein